jgi:hypothetical protein
VKAGNEKKADLSSGRLFLAQNANALPLAGGWHSAQQQVLRLKIRARSRYFALDFFA